MTVEFSGQTILVTGAASGIGEAVARQLAAAGATLVLADLDRSGGGRLADELGATFIGCDVTREQDLMEAVDLCEQQGGISGLVSSAGLAGKPSALEEIELDEWQRVMAVNSSGVFLGMKHALRAMKPRGRGAIVNVASGAGVIGATHLAHYCASKHAVLGLTKTAALENAAGGIRVNAVLPGSTRTPMLEASMQADPAVEKMILNSIPSGRMGSPAEIAEAIVWLLSERASYVNGHSLIVDGGAVSR